MKTPEQWAQEIELRCVADNRRPRMAVEADVIREAQIDAIRQAGFESRAAAAERRARRDAQRVGRAQ
jgi:hypothetical protein